MWLRIADQILVLLRTLPLFQPSPVEAFDEACAALVADCPFFAVPASLFPGSVFTVFLLSTSFLYFFLGSLSHSHCHWILLDEREMANCRLGCEDSLRSLCHNACSRGLFHVFLATSRRLVWWVFFLSFRPHTWRTDWVRIPALPQGPLAHGWHCLLVDILCFPPFVLFYP